MSVLYQRLYFSPCPAELIAAINNENAIGPDLEQIIVDTSGNPPYTSDFWFELALTPTEEALFDTIKDNFSCTGAPETIGEATNPDVVNISGTTLNIGTPVYGSGVDIEGRMQVLPADASDPNKMPAFGIVAAANIPPSGLGTVAISGEIQGIDTSAWSPNGELYVAPGGGLTNVKPTGATNLIQKICQIVEVNATTGRVLVIGAGRTNDVPNLLENHVWLGNNQDVPTPTPFIGLPFKIYQCVSGVIPKQSGTTRIPDDNSTPEITEGTEIWSDIITPSDIGHQIKIHFCMTIDASSSKRIGVTLFRNSVCIGSAVTYIIGNKKSHSFSMLVTDLPATTSPVTYSARIGRMDRNCSWYVNRLRYERFNNTMQKQGYSLEEIGS